MNAMEILKNEIQRKRKLAEELISRRQMEEGHGEGDMVSIGHEEDHKEGKNKKRYFRQSDLIKKQEEEILQKLHEHESKKQQRTLETSTPSPQQEDKNQMEMDSRTKMMNQLSELTVNEIKSRLRSLGHPITLFGENETERIHRLMTAQLDEDDTNNDYRLTAIGHENENQKDSSSRQHHDDDYIEKRDDEDDEDEDEKDQNSNHNSSYIRGNVRTNYSTTGLAPEKVIYKYFRNLLKQWEWDLDDRDDYVKQTAKGKMETKTQKQCKDYIRPLFKLCKKREVPSDILAKLVKIVKYCEEGNFRLAHDEYLQSAIGNSAWPIGLTMVGIHERSGREKISTSKVAHVMNNEMQRKYFTSVKRLMTYAQSKRPDIPPSMKSL